MQLLLSWPCLLLAAFGLLFSFSELFLFVSVGAMEPGPIAETEDALSQRLLAMLVKEVMKATEPRVCVIRRGCMLANSAVQEWDQIPVLAGLAMNDQCFVQWPADGKGQKRIPTSLSCKMNEVPWHLPYIFIQCRIPVVPCIGMPFQGTSCSDSGPQPAALCPAVCQCLGIHDVVFSCADQGGSVAW